MNHPDTGNGDYPRNFESELTVEDFRHIPAPVMPEKDCFDIMMQTSDPHATTILPNPRWSRLKITLEMFKDFLMLEPTTDEYPIPKVRLKLDHLSKEHFYGIYKNARFLDDGLAKDKYIAFEIMSHISPQVEMNLEPDWREIKFMIRFLDESDLKFYKVVRIQSGDQPPHVWRSGKLHKLRDMNQDTMDKFDSAVKHVITSMFTDEKDINMLTPDGNFRSISNGMREYYKEIGIGQWKFLLYEFSNDTTIIPRGNGNNFVAYHSPNSFTEFAFNYLAQLYMVIKYTTMDGHLKY